MIESLYHHFFIFLLLLYKSWVHEYQSHFYWCDCYNTTWAFEDAVKGELEGVDWGCIGADGWRTAEGCNGEAAIASNLVSGNERDGEGMGGTDEGFGGIDYHLDPLALVANSYLPYPCIIIRFFLFSKGTSDGLRRLQKASEEQRRVWMKGRGPMKVL